MDGRTCIAIDLKSFYASVECVDRGLDPLMTNLVVADLSRTEKTICLAVSPSLKAYGIPGRARLFEVIRKVKDVNARRRPGQELEYMVAPPRMARYIEVSSQIYSVYLKYIAPEDIHVYSIDEVFIEATEYLKLYGITAHELALRMVRDVLATTGITATAGIGPNLYLAKIAMDIEAKHSPADKDGVRIAELDETSYRRKYWSHRPLTDFWRIGHGTAAKLEANGIYTMGDIARCSLGLPYQRLNEDLLYKLFGINAELLIDHAWGWEPCRMKDIKSYTPATNSISIGQVLKEPYSNEKALVVIREMADQLSLELVEKRLVTDQMVLSIGYDNSSLKDQTEEKRYKGEVSLDHYGRKVPKPAHGSINLGRHTSSTAAIVGAIAELFSKITDKNLTVRRMAVVANHVVREEEAGAEQLDLFAKREDPLRERSRQEAILSIRKKYGKNAILKGINFEEGATAIERNLQIGGHKA